jgi:hypothetical protein
METFFMVNMADGQITRRHSFALRPSKQPAPINSIDRAGNFLALA